MFFAEGVKISVLLKLFPVIRPRPEAKRRVDLDSVAWFVWNGVRSMHFMRCVYILIKNPLNVFHAVLFRSYSQERIEFKKPIRTLLVILIDAFERCIQIWDKLVFTA